MQDTESVLVQSNIDRRTCERVLPMQVLVLGLCRTGTLCESSPLATTKSLAFNQTLTLGYLSNMAGLAAIGL